VIDWGVNGEPFLWKKRSRRRYVMIDIFSPDTSKGCYSVLTYTRNPYADEGLKGKVIGVGCATSRKDWRTAYHRARMIAKKYMKTN
jgi:hypothetical protein